MKDFFISYNKADRKWAEWIEAVLEAAGFSVVMQASDFRPGSNFVIEMHQAVSETKRTIAVLSPDYMNALYTQPEWAAAIGQDPTGSKRLLVPVRVRECKPTGLLALIVYIDLVAVTDEAEAKVLLVDGVSPAPGEAGSRAFPPSLTIAEETTAARRVVPTFPGALSPTWNVPHQRNPNFVGRDALLDQIHKTLTSKNAAALTAIHGMGGVGKTQLAAEYAYRHAADYQIVWWIRSEEASTLATDYAALAEKLDLPKKHEREQPVIVGAVRDWLNHNAGWLLVFDNARRAEDVRDYLPQNRAGHVLITSRDPGWGRVARPLKVEMLDREESVRFLLQRTGQDDETAARVLAEELGDLPLALEQAAAYIETNGKPLAEYLSLFRVRKTELLRRGKPSDYPDTVATTWEISFQELEQQSPAAGALLNLCAFLAPDDIPLQVLRDAVEHLPEALADAVADEIALDDAIAALRRYSLIERNEDRLSVHRLVQVVMRDRLSDKRNQFANSALLSVNSAFPQESDDVRTWKVCARLLPHALVAAKWSQALGLVPDATGRLLNQAGLYFMGRAQYVEAKDTFQRSLRIAEGAHGPHHLIVAPAVNNLGSVLLALGDFEGAQKCLKRTVAIVKGAFGSNHPEVAIALSNLGNVLLERGDPSSAREYIEQALRIDEAALGPFHPNVAIRLNNLGGVLNALGKLDEARQCFERARRVFEAAKGSDHPDIAICLNNIGEVLLSQGDLATAQLSFAQALEIFEASLGVNDPKVAICVDNLGKVLRGLGDLVGARQYSERALHIAELAFSPEHPHLATYLNNLGLVLFDLGDLDAARGCFERALEKYEALFGSNHPSVATAVMNLGNVLKAVGDLPGARNCFERALRIDEAAFSGDHPNVARDAHALGGVLLQFGDLAGARDHFERAAHILLKFFGEEHPNTVTVLNNLEWLKRAMP